MLLCLPADTEHGQRLTDVDVAQQLKLRERQRFFEEVFQHDVDVYLSSAHLCIRDFKRRELDRNSVYRSRQKMTDYCVYLRITSVHSLLQLQSAASHLWR